MSRRYLLTEQKWVRHRRDGVVRRQQYVERWVHCPRCDPASELFVSLHRYTTVEERWFCTRCGYRQAALGEKE